MPSREELRHCASQILDQNTASESQKFQRLIYSGKCMAPVLRDGDLVFVEKTNPKKLCMGDIVVFTEAGTHYIHRFLFLKKYPQGERRIITKADSNFKADLPVNLSNFVGRVVEIKTGGKRVNILQGRFRTVSYAMGIAAILEMSGASFFNHFRLDSVFRGLSLRLLQKLVLFPKWVFQNLFSKFLR